MGDVVVVDEGAAEAATDARAGESEEHAPAAVAEVDDDVVAGTRHAETDVCVGSLRNPTMTLVGCGRVHRTHITIPGDCRGDSVAAAAGDATGGGTGICASRYRLISMRIAWQSSNA